MENNKKWRPDILDTADESQNSKFRRNMDLTAFAPRNHTYYSTDTMKTPSGIPYSYNVMKKDYRRTKPPKSMELEVPDAIYGGNGFSQDELADFLSMYENGNPFYNVFQKGNYAPYEKNPQYDAWLQQFRDYAREKYGITDEAEADYYARMGYGNPLSPDYKNRDDNLDSMGARASRYISDMRGLKGLPDLFGRDFKK